MLADNRPLFRKDKGQVQEDGRSQIPAEQKKVGEDVCGLKIEDGHEEAKPDHTEAQKPPALLRVRAQSKQFAPMQSWPSATSSGRPNSTASRLQVVCCTGSVTSSCVCPRWRR